MDPVTRPECNSVMLGHGLVGDLAVLLPRGGPARVLSFWQPTEKERLALAAGAQVELSVYGQGEMPPVSVLVVHEVDESGEQVLRYADQEHAYS